MEEIVNSWNVQLEQDATTFTNEAVKVCASVVEHYDKRHLSPPRRWRYHYVVIYGAGDSRDKVGIGRECGGDHSATKARIISNASKC